MATDFESLMAPLCANDIAKSVRQGRPIFQSGHSAKFRGLFSRRQFDQVAKNCADLHVVYPCKNRVTMSPARPISAEEVQGHYDAGGTVCITGANRNSSRLGRLAAAFKSSLGWAGVVDCRAYLSNDGSGYTPHFDDKLVITLQIEGRKQWQVAAKASVRNPLTNAGRFPDGVYRYFKEAHTLQPWERLEQPTFPHHANTYTLSPGDILIVPSGVWHNVCAQGHSLSLAITLNHVGPGSASDIVFSTLLQQAMADPIWRGSTPMTPPQAGHMGQDSLNELDRFLVARLLSLRKIIDKNLKDRSDLVKAWDQRRSRGG